MANLELRKSFGLFMTKVLVSKPYVVGVGIGVDVEGEYITMRVLATLNTPETLDGIIPEQWKKMRVKVSYEKEDAFPGQNIEDLVF